MAATKPANIASRQRTVTVLVLFAIVLAATAALRMVVADQMTFQRPDGHFGHALWRLVVDAWAGQETTYQVVDVRLFRLVVAGTAGAALAISGVALQALLRNVLAEPFILGLSSGAAVGVMAQAMISFQLQRTIGAGYVGAVAGALITAVIVFTLGRRRRAIDPLTLLLVGVVVSTINGAIILCLNHAAGPGGVKENVSVWMMGYLNEGLSSRQVVSLMLVMLVAFVALQSQARAMDAATFSDTESMSLGVHLGRLRVLLFVVAAILAADAVMLAGPIAFVGLICPHLARLSLGPGHRAVLPAAAMLGAALVILADALSVFFDVGSGRFPIGIFIAILGGPLFLWLFRSQLRQTME